MNISLHADSHGSLPDPSSIKGEVIIHAGDLCPNFSYNNVEDALYQVEWLYQTFLPWTERLTVEKILITPGNHDLAFQRELRAVKEALSYDKRIQLLIDKETYLGGKKFFFTPWVPVIQGTTWAYMARPDTMVLARAMIPDDTQVLVSHCPVYGVLDEVNHYGCKHLLERIQELKKLEQVWVGHCHEDGGKQEIIGGVTYINAAQHVIDINI